MAAFAFRGPAGSTCCRRAPQTPQHDIELIWGSVAAAWSGDGSTAAPRWPQDQHQHQQDTGPALQSLGSTWRGASRPGIGSSGAAIDGAAVARTPERDLSFDLFLSSEPLTAMRTSSSSEVWRRLCSPSTGGREAPAQPEG